jgi:hypothetical protein
MLRVIAALAVLALSAGTAAAYIDPGVGSFVLQMMIAGALAVGASVKLFWYRIKQFLQGMFSREKESSTPQ